VTGAENRGTELECSQVLLFWIENQIAGISRLKCYENFYSLKILKNSYF
jgi:hypothetical protein